MEPWRPMARRRRRPRRTGQRQVPEQQTPGTELRRTGRARRGTLAQARDPADGRRRARRVPERRQEHAHQRDLGRQAEDRRLPVHDAGAEPRRRPGRRRHGVRRRRHPGSDRGGERGQGPRPSVPAPRRASQGALPHARPRASRRRRPRPSRSACCSHELGEYKPELLERPRIVLGTKADLVPDADAFLADRPGGSSISAVTGDGVRKAVGAMASAVHEARENEERQEGVVLLRPQPTGAKVERVAENEYRVVGRDVERVVALNDVSTFEATAYISHRLERLGVDKLLSKAGAQDGDVVWIGTSASSIAGTERARRRQDRDVVAHGRTGRHRPGGGREAQRRGGRTSRRRQRGDRGVVGRGRGRCRRARPRQTPVATSARCRRSPPPGKPV